MQSPFVRAVCRILLVCFTAVSFQARAGLVGTGEVAGAVANAQAARSLLTGKLQSFGITADAARDRVAALTDAEAVKLAGEVEHAAAGGFPWGLMFLAVFLLWRFTLSEQAQAEAKQRQMEREKAKK